MKNVFRSLAAGFIFAIGIGLGAMTWGGAQAASVALFTGPAGTNPINNPSMLGDMNTLISSMNATLAPGGTGTMPGYVNLTGSATATTGFLTPTGGTNPTYAPLGIGLPEFINPGSWTFNTSTNCGGPNKGTTAGLSGTTACLIVQDVSGTVHYIPAY